MIWVRKTSEYWTMSSRNSQWSVLSWRKSTRASKSINWRTESTSTARSCWRSTLRRIESWLTWKASTLTVNSYGAMWRSSPKTTKPGWTTTSKTWTQKRSKEIWSNSKVTMYYYKWDWLLVMGLKTEYCRLWSAMWTGSLAKCQSCWHSAIKTSNLDISKWSSNV